MICGAARYQLHGGATADYLVALRGGEMIAETPAERCAVTRWRSLRYPDGYPSRIQKRGLGTCESFIVLMRDLYPLTFAAAFG